MARDKTKRVAPSVLAEDEDVFARLQNIPAYAPSNPAFTAAKMQTAIEEARAAREAETRAEAAHAQARDLTVEKEWNVHDTAVGIRDQVTAQFGKNSAEVQIIGRKREDEYKKRARKGSGSNGQSGGSQPPAL
jgi:hypothetical protein